LVSIPLLSAALVMHLAAPPLYAQVSDVSKQSLEELLRSEIRYTRPGIEDAVRRVQELKRAAEAGSLAFFWVIAVWPCLVALGAAFIMVVLLWVVTNAQVVEGSFRRSRTS
jgi:hypothetical protein